MKIFFVSMAYCLWCARRAGAFVAISTSYQGLSNDKVHFEPTKCLSGGAAMTSPTKAPPHLRTSRGLPACTKRPTNGGCYRWSSGRSRSYLQSKHATSSCVHCPPKAEVTRSNRVGCASFFLFFSGICAPGLKLQLCVIRVSKRLGGKSSPNADSFVKRAYLTVLA